MKEKDLLYRHFKGYGMLLLTVENDRVRNLTIYRVKAGFNVDFTVEPLETLSRGEALRHYAQQASLVARQCLVKDYAINLPDYTPVAHIKDMTIKELVELRR